MKINSNLCILLTVFLAGACLYIPIDAYSVNSFDVSAQDSEPSGITFSNNGAKMFVLGASNATIYEYALSTPFNVATSTLTTSFSVITQNTHPTDVTFSNNGTEMFVVGTNGQQGIYEYILSAPFNVTTFTHTATISVSSQDTEPRGIAFSSNGTKMFVVGDNNDAVYEFALSAPFNVTTFTHTATISISSQDTEPQGIAFSSNGTKMFVVGDNNDAVYEYTLSAPFNIDTATFTTSISVSSQDTEPRGIAFSSNGTKMFVVGDNNNAVYEYTLPAPFVLGDIDLPTFTARSNSPTQTTVTFSEGVNGTLRFSEWSFDGSNPTAVSEQSDNSTISKVTRLVFTHNITNNQTLYVEYTGSMLTDNGTNRVITKTVTATDGIIPTFTARSNSPTQTTVTFSEGVIGTLRFSEWSFDGSNPTAVSEQSDNSTISKVTRLVFTHNITNNQTLYVEYTGSMLTDNGTNKVVARTVTATDGIHPVIAGITSDARTLGYLKVGDTITFTLTTSLAESEDTVIGTYNSQAQSWSTSNNGATYTATYTVSEGDASQITPLQITNVTITDAAGNTSSQTDGSDVQKSIDANFPVFSSSTLNEETGVFTITFNEIINAHAINSTGFTIMDNNTNTSDVTLSTSELTTNVNDETVSFTLTSVNRKSVISQSMSYLDMATGAVQDIAGNQIAASKDNPIATTIRPEPCSILGPEDWIITSDCTLSTNYMAPANVIVRNNAVLVIIDGITLDINFANNNLTIESGSGVLIKSGAVIT